jgi:cytochrome c peroxidase
VTITKRFAGACLAASVLWACSGTPSRKAELAPPPPWEAANPNRPLPKPPLGIGSSFSSLAEPPTPERVRLGRWLFYDTRLSANGEISCATCHRPENGFSEPTAVSTGIGGQKGTRKTPSFVNQAWTLYPYFFWDGRAVSLEEQALAPIANPIEMGNTHETMIATLLKAPGYKPYFKEAFGSEEITKERVAKAIADYERTRMSGGSPWDKWKKNKDEGAVSDEVKRGDELFFGKAECNQCHLGQNLTDSLFHNLGIGWDAKAQKFKDEGRVVVSKMKEDTGAFKTPGLRDVAKRATYMHDGSLATLQEVVQHYNKGGIQNPYLSPKLKKLRLTEAEVAALVTFMEALSGEGYMDTAPAAYPQ